MKAAAAVSNKWPRASCTDGSFNPEVTCCSLFLLNRRTFQKVSMVLGKQSLPPNFVATASSNPDFKSGSGGGKSIVDANMPLLRKRLKRLKLKERNNEMSTPDGGERIQWEEELSPSYQCKIWEPICLLHNYLMPLASLSVMALVVAASVLFVWGIIVIKIHPCGFGACSLAILS